MAEVEKCGALNTNQIKLLHFQGIKNDLRVCQQRLKKLTEKKKLQRARSEMNHSFYYYIDKKPGQVDHKLGINWIYVWFKRNLKSWEELYCWECEVDYDILRCDAFCGIKNTVTGEIKFHFIEMDRAESGHPFKKVQLYNALFSSEKYLGRWWVQYTEKFPEILIVTTGDLYKIKGKVEKENANDLAFRVLVLDRVIKECE